MPLTWNAILLGTADDIDSDESTFGTETSFMGSAGSAENPLFEDIVTFSINDVDGDNRWDTNNAGQTSEVSTLTTDGVSESVVLDSTTVYNATITYVDGTTADITAVVIQLTDGRVYLAPEYIETDDDAALNAQPIQSIQLGSVIDTETALVADRFAGDFVTCFTADSRIMTALGEVAARDLAVGDLVLTLDHGPQPIRWIGRRIVPATGDLAPIEFARGVLGATAALRVSPNHRMLLTGWQAELLFGEPEVLVPAKALVNDQTIRRKAGGTVEYIHIMFDHHEIITANGVPSESFHPNDYTLSAIGDDTRDELYHLFPQLRHNPARYGDTARMSLTATEARLIRPN
ncbi:Hint domain-containing protein [Pseudaestuariivita rosea]|uniref:Hint domain-containing protein n=1 Tax=Pseudaestuariivita rosea TaxID=2763263 RepID=UPI001ABA0C03|nr:Hint domain-containing protein [Pseudaestuariivita rosea]